MDSPLLTLASQIETWDKTLTTRTKTCRYNADTSSNYNWEYSDNYNIDISNRAKQYKVVYDLEQLSNFHSCTALDYRTQTVYLFVIHESRNDIVSYINFLERCVVMSGYNNINYDYPMLHYILTNKDSLVLLTPQQINKILYAESQRIIDSGKLAGSTGFKKRTIPANQIIIPQLDLMAINSLTNEARRASLKQLQFAMRWHNLQEMPIHHYSVVKTEQVPMILSYNLNDVASTYEFLKYSLDRIAVRQQLTQEYVTDLMNADDIKMGVEIFASELTKDDAAGDTDKHLNLRNSLKRNIIDYSALEIKVDDIILPYIKFKQEPFKCVLDLFRQSVMTPDTIPGFFTDIPLSKVKPKLVKNSDGTTHIDPECILKYTNKNQVNKRKGVLETLNVIYDGCEYVFGAGGLHMSISPQIVISDEEWTIHDRDVRNMRILRPNLVNCWKAKLLLTAC